MVWEWLHGRAEVVLVVLEGAWSPPVSLAAPVQLPGAFATAPFLIRAAPLLAWAAAAPKKGDIVWIAPVHSGPRPGAASSPRG